MIALNIFGTNMFKMAKYIHNSFKLDFVSEVFIFRFFFFYYCKIFRTLYEKKKVNK